MNTTPSFESYPFRIEPLAADEGGGFAILFPDLPGCMSDGETVEEAIANGRDAFNAWMEAQIADGRPIPEPNGEGVPARFVQRLPQSQHAQLIRAAAAEGVSMNTLVTTFIADGLARREAGQVLDSLERAAAKVLGALERATEQLAAPRQELVVIKKFPSATAAVKSRQTDVGSRSDVRVWGGAPGAGGRIQ